MNVMREEMQLQTDRTLARAKRQQMMLEDPMIRVIPKMAIPMIISTMIDSVYNLADTFFVSTLGETATAAVAVNDSLMHVLTAVAMAFAMGGSTYVSRLMGAKKDKQACNVATTTLGTGFLLSLVIGLICFAFRGSIVDLLGSTPDAHNYSVDYATWILLAAPFTTGNMIMNQMLRSEGSSTYAMVGMTSGCIINCILDPIFIMVFHWGVAGAAAATALSKVISFTLLSMPYIRHTAMLEIHPKHFYFEKEAVLEVARMGVPTFFRFSLMSFGSVVTNNVAKGFGTAVLAGMAVANKLSRFIGSFIMGFAQGFGPVAGFCWGAKKYSRMKSAYFTTMGIGFVLCVILGTTLFIFAEPLISIFNSSGNEKLLQIGVLKVRSLCLAFPPHMFVMISSNLFQSLGRPVENLILSMSRQLLLLIPLVLIVPLFLGENGLACCEALSDAMAGILLGLPFVLSLMRKINKLNDGDTPPFSRTS